MCHSERVPMAIVLAIERICNLAYIFNPAACAAMLSKSTSQRLLNWRTFMNEFSYIIRHIPGAANHQGDLLSRL